MTIPCRSLLASLVVAAPAVADVYVGTAFRIRQFVERPQEWADVAAHATGNYLHPNSVNETKELKGAEQKKITDLFKHRVVITERNNGGAPDGDVPQYELMRSLGMTPVGGMVAEINDDTPWALRVGRSQYDDKGKAVHVPLYADQRPWTSEWNRTPEWTIDQIDKAAKTGKGLANRLAILDHADGLALETDLTRSTTQGSVDPTLKHFRICLKMLEYAKAKGKKTLLFLHGFEKADVGRYTENNLGFVRALEAEGIYPDGFIVSFYDEKAPLQLLPETTIVDGQRRPANTLAGMAWAVLAREGEVPLTPAESPTVKVLNAEGHGVDADFPLPTQRSGEADFSVVVANPNRTLDFAPGIEFDGDGVTGVFYAFGDEAYKPLTKSGIRFVGPNALPPGGTRMVHVHVDPANHKKTVGVKAYFHTHAFHDDGKRRLIAEFSARGADR